jgi:hypothetical protein
MTRLEAVAATLGLEYESNQQFKSEYQYQSTRTKKQIFTAGGDYFCMNVTKPTDEVGNDWALHPDQFWAEKVGSKLWISKEI